MNKDRIALIALAVAVGGYLVAQASTAHTAGPKYALVSGSAAGNQNAINSFAWLLDQTANTIRVCQSDASNQNPQVKCSEPVAVK